MLETTKLIGEMDDYMYQNLWENLKGISPEELDWQLRPEANSVRWIMGHLIWFEEWASDAYQGVERYLTDTGPLAYDIATIEEIKERFDKAVEGYNDILGRLTEADLTRKIDCFWSLSDRCKECTYYILHIPRIWPDIVTRSAISVAFIAVPTTPLKLSLILGSKRIIRLNAA